MIISEQFLLKPLNAPAQLYIVHGKWYMQCASPNCTLYMVNGTWNDLFVIVYLC